MEYKYKQKEISNGQETHKDCETTLDIRKIQIKKKCLRFQLTRVRMNKI